MNRDVVFSLGMLILSVIAFAETFSFPEGSRFRVGPEVYPRYIIGAIAAMSLALLVRTLIIAGIGFDRRAFDMPRFFRRYARTLAIFVTFGFYAALLPIVGFVPSTAAFLVVAQLIVEPTLSAANVLRTLVVAAVATGFVYLVFTRALQLYLP